MYYISLFVFLTVGTISGWFLIGKIVSGTEHIPTAFEIQERARASSSNTEEIIIEGFEQPAETMESVESQVVTDAELNPLSLESINEGEPESLEIDVVPEALADKEKEESLRADSAGVAAQEFDDEGTGPSSDIPKAKPPKPKAVVASLNLRDQKEPEDKQSVRAIDLAYAVPDESACVVRGDGYPKVGVFYRATSASIKGASLSNMDKLISLYEKCGGGKLILLNNQLGDGADSNERLIQRRQDEIKYYLIQRRIPKEDIIFPDKL